ncbi:MAG: acyltransferase [Flavobacteriia bacterium]|nr:acyltransferase [Flavobacteriia bacterium]
MKNENHELNFITSLRGLACLSVCIGHFSGTISNASIFHIFHYGIWGVHLFFIISGFILPYSMKNKQYKIVHFPLFLFKRIIRLEPPYLISIFIIVLISFLAQLSPNHTSTPINFYDINLIYNIFYVVEFFNGNWLNVVFWSLAIEFQFYIVLAIIFPLLNHSKIWIRYCVYILLLFSFFALKNDDLIFHYILFFLIGWLFYLFHDNQIKIVELLINVIFIIFLLFFTFGLVGLVCPLIFLVFYFFFIDKESVLMFFGKISYSMYLLHTPLGTDSFVQFFQNYFSTTISQIIIAILGLGFVIFCSWIYFLFIEKWFIQLSKKINFH